MRFPRSIFSIVVVLAALGGLAQATIVVRVTVEDLAEKATIIVRGEVLDAKAHWTEDGRTIRTSVRIRVDETLKGDPGSEVVLTCPGGEVGKDKMEIHGVPKFKAGEKVVVFGWKNREGSLLPLALNQGKFVIEKDKESGVEMAKNSLEGLALATVRPPETSAEREALKNADSLPLADLRKRVRARLVKMEEAAAKAAAAKAESTREDAPAPEKGQETAKPAEDAGKKDAGEAREPEPKPEKKRR